MFRCLFLFFLACLSCSWLFAQFQLNGNSSSLGNECYQITPASTAQNGSIWSQTQLDLSNSFNLYIRMNFGCSDGGADGMAFALQQAGLNATGISGDGIGYGGITPSLGVEFDTYQNGGFGDPIGDHIGVFSNGTTDHTSLGSLAGPVDLLSGGGNAEDCSFHDVHIAWDAPNTTLRVYVDCNLRITYTANIVSTIFGNNPSVYWGFTASTGALTNAHQICMEYTPTTRRLTDTTICKGDVAPVSVSPGNSFSWTPIAGVSNPSIGNPTLSPDTTSTYYVTITDVCSFVWTDSIIVEVATVDAGPNQLVGFGQPTMLNSTYYGPPAAPNCMLYPVSTITYAPVTLTSPTAVTLGNDQVSGAIPIGFDFDFFCNTYTQLYISSNGWLSFTLPANSFPNAAAIPSANTPNDLIAFCWADLDPSQAGGSIQYQTLGTFPNRTFVLDVNVQHTFASFCAGGTCPVTLQVILHENDGAIEIHTRDLNPGWFGTMSQGIENATGTLSTVYSGRSLATWTATNEGLRFEPQPAAVTYSWTPAGMLNDPTLEDPTATVNVDTWFYVTLDNGTCMLTDSVLLTITALGIEIVDFEATGLGQKVQLDWALSEVLKDEQIVLRHSTDNMDYHTIETFYTADQTTFSTTHHHPSSGENHYQLHLIDVSGNVLETQTVSLFLDHISPKFLPNPTMERTYLTFWQEKAASISLTVFDVAGKKVKAIEHSAPQGHNTIAVDFNGLPAGLYFYRLRLGEEVYEGKLVKE